MATPVGAIPQNVTDLIAKFKTVTSKLAARIAAADAKVVESMSKEEVQEVHNEFQVIHDQLDAMGNDPVNPIPPDPPAPVFSRKK